MAASNENTEILMNCKSDNENTLKINEHDLTVDTCENKLRDYGREIKNGRSTACYSTINPTKLLSSEKAWKPFSRTDQIIGEKEKLKRNVQAVLNKLTFQKFKILLSQLKKLNIDTVEDIELVVNLIYENAINEPHFCILYANLCKYLALKMPFDNASTTKEFCKLLMSKCKAGFEEQYQVLSSNGCELSPHSLLENKKIKSRRIGNIRFVGELFKFKVIPTSTVLEWVGSLLPDGFEDRLEFFYWFMKTAGKELESQEKLVVDEYFQQIQKTIDNRCTSSRIRFLLQDIVDLRESNWIPRRLENLPRTIDEIHLEAALELQRTSALHHQGGHAQGRECERREAATTVCSSCLCGESSAQPSNSTTPHSSSFRCNSRPSPPDEVKSLLLSQDLRKPGRKNRNRKKGGHKREDREGR